MKNTARKTRSTEGTRPQIRTTLGELARDEADAQLALGIRNLVRGHLREFVISAGTAALAAVLEQERTQLVGARYARLPERQARRAGSAPSELVMGGRRVQVRRPRARTLDGQELQHLAQDGIAENQSVAITENGRSRSVVRSARLQIPGQIPGMIGGRLQPKARALGDRAPGPHQQGAERLQPRKRRGGSWLPCAARQRPRDGRDARIHLRGGSDQLACLNQCRDPSCPPASTRRARGHSRRDLCDRLAPEREPGHDAGTTSSWYCR
jgi:hypothetical protein